jgi:hypothetical protein
MNDHDAMTAINAVLDAWFKGEINEVQALSRITITAGKNYIHHDEAKGATA